MVILELPPAKSPEKPTHSTIFVCGIAAIPTYLRLGIALAMHVAFVRSATGKSVLAYDMRHPDDNGMIFGLHNKYSP
jgi:hypothetical protein